MAFISITALPAWGQPQRPASDEPLQRFESSLGKLAGASADDCGWDSQAGPTFSEDTANLENKLFDAVDDAIISALNASPDNPKKTVTELLEKMKATSANLNKTWLAERRFHFDILYAQPALVVKIGIRSRTTFSVFAVPEMLPGPRETRTQLGSGLMEVKDGGENTTPTRASIFSL